MCCIWALWIPLSSFLKLYAIYSDLLVKIFIVEGFLYFFPVYFWLFKLAQIVAKNSIFTVLSSLSLYFPFEPICVLWPYITYLSSSYVVAIYDTPCQMLPFGENYFVHDIVCISIFKHHMFCFLHCNAGIVLNFLFFVLTLW